MPCSDLARWRRVSCLDSSGAGTGRRRHSPPARRSRSSRRCCSSLYLMPLMPRILVTNDDGYRSDGIRALAEALGACGDVTIVAPFEEASAIGHALTLRHPLRLERVDAHTCAVDGTPTDCVNIAVSQVFHALPDLVVSGINKG